MQETVIISDTTLFITPNMTLNFESNNLEKVGNYEKFMTSPLNTKLYCYFDYDFATENEKVLDIKSRPLQKANLINFTF